MTTVESVPTATAGRRAQELRRRRRRTRPARVALHVFLVATCLLWLVPLLWAFYTSLRPYSDTAKHGYFSVAHSLGFGNYTKAWSQADFLLYFRNTLFILVPALIITLLLASFIGFTVARFSFRFNVTLLILFTAGNLLPQQVLITPLYRMFLLIPLPHLMSDSGELYDSYWGVILANVVFQTGFCAFVLSNYMRTLPHELTEAAMIDGAGVLRQYWQVVLPLCRPALAALATLEFTWIYNDFFWALTLMQSGDKRPVTSALNNLKGQFFTDNNLIAAGALIVAVPTLVVYFALQKQFISGLTLGANKG